ncbi:hypothetical protein [Catenulispora sp. GAS73]|uniref:hypothetical protein n=1 Tax=Catenulispora sp. GAS73 TaxID=3156269 RepID=UPI003510F3AD
MTEQDKGKVITVAKGKEILLVLFSTYWQQPTASGSGVLTALDTPRISAPPIPMSTYCGNPVPGSGCGLKVYAFDATSAGTSVISTSRTSCGEAMGCTGSKGSYSATVDVAAANG